MKIAQNPTNEAERLEALKSYEILDTIPTQEFDDITQIASQICGTPISLISLLDEDRQWFKSKHGLAASETPRDISFCGHAINEPENIFEIPNALEDDRFHDNPLVTQNPNIRFYAGAPLVTPKGEALGTLCVISDKPKKLTAAQRQSLRSLARQVMAQLMLQRKNKILTQQLAEVKASKVELEHLALVASKTHSAVIITNAKGEIEYANPAFEELTEYKLSEVIGKKPGSFLQGKDTSPEHAHRMRMALSSLKPFTQRILNYTKSGNPYWLSCSISPVFDEHQNLIKFVAVEQDITEQMKNEEALILAREEAITGELVKDQFLSNMSHEIRTPMNGIIGISNILLKTDDLADSSRELVEHINGAANHLLVIINDILDLSKINAEKLTFEKINFAFPNIFETLKYSLGLQAEEKGIDFNIELDPNIPENIAGDPTRFNQILLNLTSNAIKFTERGSVTISTSLLEINEKGPRVLFKVKDTGIGIREDKIGGVFEQFSQSNCTITRRFGGTGLGLSIAKKLIEMHEGSVSVQSKINEGSIFVFNLQFYSEIQEKAEEDNTTFIDLTTEEKAGIRILLAEDNKLNQIVATKQVRNFGFQIEVAENGLEAIEMLRKNEYDLILMDVNMPMMNGLDATRFIRQNLREKSNINIAAMTASVLSKDIQLCYDAGMNDFISKPFIPSELYEKIIGLVGRNSDRAKRISASN